jgi:alpha,alpha-trehalase
MHISRRHLIVLALFAAHSVPGLSLFAQVKPEDAYPRLFEAVQLQPVFADSKTFPDCAPRFGTERIRQEYDSLLREFVARNFDLPEGRETEYRSDPGMSVEEHIRGLWGVLTRNADEARGSLIALPRPYVVPGGRFREIYYWDSYFTMLGLQASGKDSLVVDMVDNFTWLIDTLGFIPNGNRTYYTSRSQPPFYAMMLRVLQEVKGESVIVVYLPELLKEYAFWMDGADSLSPDRPSYRRVVRMGDGSVLNRYWDNDPSPRPESYAEDRRLAERSGRAPADVYRNVRAAAESGWDFSGRWFADGKSLATIHTTDIVPVDLNSLLYNIEMTIAGCLAMRRDETGRQRFLLLARLRAKALNDYCWSEGDGFYMDYDFVAGRTTPVRSLAALYPLFFNIAPGDRAEKVARIVREEFLSPGGLVTTLSPTGQQWDAPNGWAPLQWIGVKGLRNYGFAGIADSVRGRWLRLNERVYRNTGKMMEKYNVIDTGAGAGGGEYDLQDGFGWTNGVYLKLKSPDR